jgi:hypothetical protein
VDVGEGLSEEETDPQLIKKIARKIRPINSTNILWFERTLFISSSPE